MKLDADQITDNIWISAFPTIKQELDQFTHIINISGINYTPPNANIVIKNIDYIDDVDVVDI
jgi:hypothetical protein